MKEKTKHHKHNISAGFHPGIDKYTHSGLINYLVNIQLTFSHFGWHICDKCAPKILSKCICNSNITVLACDTLDLFTS